MWKLVHSFGKTLLLTSEECMNRMLTNLLQVKTMIINQLIYLNP